MAKITKTKSGKYRTLVFYIDENGKRCRKSFTHEDKNTVKFLAADFLANQKDAHKENRMTVGEALKRYTDSKENVLSPSTIRSYRTICRNSLAELQKVRLCDLTNEVIQRAINVETAKHKPKTVSNIYGLLTAALGMFLPEFRPAATLPQKKRYEAVVPVDRQIKELLALAAGTDVEIPIILAAMGSLREGEIAPLLVEDILDSGVRVNKSMVRNQNEQWEIKPVPKTQAGERVAPLPKEVITKIREAVKDKEPGDRLCDMTPAMIYKHYANLRGQCGMERCRFHDLRHSAATNMHQLTGDFYTVGEILGHTLAGINASLGLSMNFEAVTARYVDVRFERKKEVLEAYHGALKETASPKREATAPKAAKGTTKKKTHEMEL